LPDDAHAAIAFRAALHLACPKWPGDPLTEFVREPQFI